MVVSGVAGKIAHQGTAKTNLEKRGGTVYLVYVTRNFFTSDKGMSVGHVVGKDIPPGNKGKAPGKFERGNGGIRGVAMGDGSMVLVEDRENWWSGRHVGKYDGTSSGRTLSSMAKESVSRA